MIRAALLRRHLTDDQRAALAVKWQKIESKQAQSAAGHKAVSIRHRKYDPGTVPGSYKPRDIRKEAAWLFAVSEWTVRQVAEVVNLYN